MIYYPDIACLKNRVMMNIEVPAFWHLDFSAPITASEIDHAQKLHQNVIFIKLNEVQSQTSLGINLTCASTVKVAELFSKFGDINVVKATENSCFVEFQDLDTDIIKIPKQTLLEQSSQEQRLGLQEKTVTPAKEIIKLIKKEMAKKGSNSFKDIICEVKEYKDADKFTYDGQSYEGGF